MRKTKQRSHTILDIPFPVPDVDAGNDGTGAESLLTTNVADGTRPPPTGMLLPVLLRFFRPSSANALPATEEDGARDFANLNMGRESRFRRFFEGITDGRQLQDATGSVSEEVGFIWRAHVAVVIDVECF